MPAVAIILAGFGMGLATMIIFSIYKKVLKIIEK